MLGWRKPTQPGRHRRDTRVPLGWCVFYVVVSAICGSSLTLIAISILNESPGQVIYLAP